MSKASSKEIKRINHNNGLRSSLNSLGQLALEIVRRIEPLAKARLLEREERDNLSLAKDILVNVRRLQLEAKRVKAAEKGARAAEDAADDLPKVTDDLKRLAAQLLVSEQRRANSGKQTAFRSEAKADDADA